MPIGMGGELGRHDQPAWLQVIRVVQIVEFGAARDLERVERGALAEVDIAEIAELVERDDVGDVQPLGIQSPG
ncbi:hypothetical protein MSAR_07730 [Mycolicibacterium sarraceniae]|uniref:Uncharacterized protein n=1 Tax=Mycolicibacterium sarraceniae TaxID=1534348 RepID=A0A7I7SKW5_9MYCO|nr:hypothetical protein MSAR_07730 [Mycolicibacterium sarraceniae]